ncbi:tyrosine-type recombinase/integrase [Pseudomonas sp. S37]|uniref:tyrosine-type recombinase/integrase n=1 Tax=Pseudomonas sp. S37 TaxID=2767449 RepID=UPI0019126AD2|nr:tyrosine-type recombinase/integrase [Pseudomonas sp. S37]MBK4992384.1 tyrosine-type recombinase/integrase [Pseudomonas sp. S37]
MRVPVHPNDLLRNTGLKKIAKDLQKLWRGPNPLTHTSALELLAQGLGYSGYQDLAASATEQMPAGTFPSQSAVKQALMLSIKAAMTPSDWFSSDQAAMAQMIKSLRFRALSAFKVPSSVFQPPRHGEPSSGSDMRVLRDRMARSAQQLSSQLLTGEELEALSRAITATESLRDQALMSCMMAGLRTGEYLRARPSDFSVDQERSLFVSRGPKKARVTVPHKYWTPISRFITTANLEENALLFQSKRSPDISMSPLALRKVCEAWADKAGIDPAKVSPLTIRMSVKWNAAMKVASGVNPLSRVEMQMGHWPVLMTMRYLDGTLKTKRSD